ncbi:MAG: transcription-repair coupling factor [Gomphosphaeria aponina SAG 52.96 = DSM 107014]|uniref:Transcription-repair-coupling factor n=1 Tax=Gomphosphaeria aponina SAG 52.96 = DSM 107014 TaxID=1521640 RepID=A0A941GSV6_9CHRO|nr:transcription-repair coupling factor [Gomphosphaeria aponina SAG 52.96 = DSM 107014]
MTFASVIRALEQSSLTEELQKKLDKKGMLSLTGLPRLPKGLVASSLANLKDKNLLVITATIEEAGRWAAQLEAMGWKAVHFYPTSEATPYDPESSEEMIWGQMQVLADLQLGGEQVAIVATERSLQPHLPPAEIFQNYCLTLSQGMVWEAKDINAKLTKLGYERVPLVESEGQWSRRGDIIDIFPVAAELPVRLEWLGDELEQLREFDPATQRSLDEIKQLILTPTTFAPIIAAYLPEIEEIDKINCFLGAAFAEPACLLDYLPENTLCAVDELAQCRAHGDRWVEYAEEQWEVLNRQTPLIKLHRGFDVSLSKLTAKFSQLYLSELVDERENEAVNLSSRPLPVTPHQFATLAEIIRGKRPIYSGITLDKYSTWLISAQPSRLVSLLQEHDCPAQFIPNPKDYRVVEKLHLQNTATALKYSGVAELEGFVLPTFRIVVVTDRDVFGQHSLATPGYVRKRRRAAAKQVDINKLSPGNYVTHKNHGVGQFIKLESLENREYLVIKYADGLLRVPADSLELLAPYRQTPEKQPTLHKMSSQAWKQAKNKVRKAVKKLAVDLVKLYARRSQLSGYAYPADTPWQLELEDSFPYQPTPDQLKAVQDVKRDLESDRPMDRLVCGDVGFGKTEVAIRAIFKAVTSGNKQVAFLAPTTILTQQHYHTLKERFAPYPINVGLLNRFRNLSERKEILERLATGELDIVVGTQQLLGKGTKFRDLGLLVIDEEQRFGVNQKEKVKEMKTQVDVLTLTATPIPRTLYMSLSGIREMSLITTPPPSRRPIKTHLAAYNLEIIRTAIRNELDRGGQIFYVVPRVEGIEEVAGKIQEKVPGARIAIGHGQMAEAELEQTMLAFNNGEADILVCTTIIESGLDIPRVNTIIVEDAQKFGLAQLYQLRGRVGRAGVQAHAWLLYPRQETLTETARKRLQAIQEFTQLGSGYHLAMRDMEIRGIGSLLGAEQSGQMEAIGFELYMEMLQEAIREVQGQEIPKVEDTQIDLQLTAFIPANYIGDLEQKMAAYRAVATAGTLRELQQIEAEWSDRYGPVPPPAQQLLKIVELKQIAKSVGFSRIKPEGKHNIVLETPMEEPAWKLLLENLPKHLHSRFVYAPKKVIVRGLGVLKPQKQLENLIEWLDKMQDGLPDLVDS